MMRQTRPSTLSPVPDHATVNINNPLGVALFHFRQELEWTLTQLGLPSRVVEWKQVESGRSRLRRMFGAWCQHASAARMDADLTLTIWPTWGYWQTLVDRSVHPTKRNVTLYHDVTPLRRQFGYSRLAQRTHSRAAGPLSLSAVLTDAAAAQFEVVTGAAPDLVLPHPILPQKASIQSATRIVLVCGQFKPSRDLKLLRLLGQHLVSANWRPRIVGRGWPSLENWEQREGFLTEADLAAEIGGAAVVLVPYREYYASGIAIRALESAVPAVGIEHPFMREVFGMAYPGLVSEGSSEDASEWLRAMDAVVADAPQLQSIHKAYTDRVIRVWRSAF